MFDVLVGINLLREGIDLPEVTLVAILDADKEGFLRSAWSLIQMIGRAARNIGGEVIMYADKVTESMQVAIDETDRRRAVQDAYNVEKGIEPTTIVKGIHDLNQRLRAVAESTIVYTSEREGGRPFDESDRVKVEALVTRMEAEMRGAAKELEFERAAALRDEIQQIRLRVLEQDASVTVARAAERAAQGDGRGGDRPDGRRGPGARSPGGRGPGGIRAVARGHERHRAARRGGARGVAGRRAGRSRHGVRLAARDPRRARRRSGLAGTLAGPADMGPDGHPEHPQADRPAAGPIGPPAGLGGAGFGAAGDRWSRGDRGAMKGRDGRRDEPPETAASLQRKPASDERGGTSDAAILVLGKRHTGWMVSARTASLAGGPPKRRIGDADRAGPV